METDRVALALHNQNIECALYLKFTDKFVEHACYVPICKRWSIINRNGSNSQTPRPICLDAFASCIYQTWIMFFSGRVNQLWPAVSCICQHCEKVELQKGIGDKKTKTWIRKNKVSDISLPLLTMVLDSSTYYYYYPGRFRGPSFFHSLDSSAYANRDL